MKRSSLIALFMAIFMVTATTIAFAGKMHFTSAPTVTLGTLTVQGDLAGIGGGNGAEVTVTATGTAQVPAICQNKGGNRAPGQNPVTAKTTGQAIFTVIDNGKVAVSVTIPDPTLADVTSSLSAAAAGCPNGNWKVVDIDLASLKWVFLNITATSPTNPTYVTEGPCTTNLSANTVSCSLVDQ